MSHFAGRADITVGRADMTAEPADIIAGRADITVGPADMTAGPADIIVGSPDIIVGSADIIAGSPDITARSADITADLPISPLHLPISSRTCRYHRWSPDIIAGHNAHVRPVVSSHENTAQLFCKNGNRPPRAILFHHVYDEFAHRSRPGKERE